jgi:hypothetical protein
MNIFERNYDYDYDYQSYLDWKEKDEQEQLEQECEWYERELQQEEEEEEEETTGERCVREAQEEDVRQLAQVSVGGLYRYELEWLPETHEIRVEVDRFRDGSPFYLWYPDNMGTMKVLSKLLNIPEERISITGLKFFTEERVIDDLFDYERWQFPNNTWRDYAEDGMAMQFNVEIAYPHLCYDAACDGTNCDFKPYCYDPACDGTNCELKHVPPPVRPHGIDGTQCDCSDCTLHYGLCSCGCGGNNQLHEEWLAEREKERQEFVHETVTPPPTPEPELEPEPESPKPILEMEEEDDDKSETSVESAEEKEDRLWSDFKLAIMSALMALMLGAYICRSLIC